MDIVLFIVITVSIPVNRGHVVSRLWQNLRKKNATKQIFSLEKFAGHTIVSDIFSSRRLGGKGKLTRLNQRTSLTSKPESPVIGKPVLTRLEANPALKLRKMVIN